MPGADYWDEEDEWDTYRHVSGARHVPPPPPRRPIYGDARRSDRDFLYPEQGSSHTHGLHRTRSQGASPTPNVTIYNTTRMDNESSPNVRTEQRSPMPSPRGRPLRMPGEFTLEDELAELRLEVAQQKRSRSRSAHHHHRDESYSPTHHHNFEYEQERWKLQQANERLKEQEERAMQDKREELIKKRIELRYLKDKQEQEEREAQIKAEEDRLKKEWELKLERDERKRIEQARKAEDERKRIIADNMEQSRRADEERKRLVEENLARMKSAEAKAKAEQQAAVDAYNKKRAEDEAKAKAAQQAAVDAYNKKKAEEEAKADAERKRVIAEYERKKVEDAEKAKRQRDELLLQIKIEEEKKKAKEKEEYERFLFKQKQKEDEEKAKKKKEEEELEEAMRKKLFQFGFQENQIQAMVKPEKAKELHAGLTPHNPLQLAPQPTYVKVHREHLEVDTLSYYSIPWEYDRTDPSYIIILREMDAHETEILFEHTRRLRSRNSSTLLIEERNDHGRPDYAWVRRRSKSREPSTSRRRSSPKRIHLFR